MWRNGNIYSLLPEVQAGAATVEITKVGLDLPCGPAATSRHPPGLHICRISSSSIAALLTVARTWEL